MSFFREKNIFKFFSFEKGGGGGTSFFEKMKKAIYIL